MDEKPVDQAAPMRASFKLFATGISATTVYMVFWGWILEGRWGELKTAPLNNIGDFVAGAFAPLAFLWLVLGFIQQGIELRQNSEALRLQAKELADSAQQQRELVRATREQLALEVDVEVQEQERLRRAALPTIVTKEQYFPFALDGARRIRIVFRNVGAPCTFPSIAVSDPNLIASDVYNREHWASHTTGCHIEFTQKADESRPSGGVTVSFVDASGRPGHIDYQLNSGFLYVVKSTASET